MGFNECLGFLDPLIGVYGRALKFEVFQVGMKGFFYRTAAAQMRKRAVTLGIPRGCANILRVRKIGILESGMVNSHFILEKHYHLLASPQRNSDRK